MKRATWYWIVLGLICAVVIVQTWRWSSSYSAAQDQLWSEIGTVKELLAKQAQLMTSDPSALDEAARLIEEASQIEARWEKLNAVQAELKAATSRAQEAVESRGSALRQAAIDASLNPRTNIGPTDYRLVSAAEAGLRGERRVIRIMIPFGRSRDNVTETIRAAIRDHYTSDYEHVLVFAYRTIDDPENTYTAGKGELVMGDAGTQGYLRYIPLVQIEVADAYFDGDPRERYPVGSVWTLRTRAASRVTFLSSKPDGWAREDLTVRVEAGARVEVTAVRFYPTAMGDMVRVRVRTMRGLTEQRPDGLSPRPEAEGWADADDLEPLAPGP